MFSINSTSKSFVLLTLCVMLISLFTTVYSFGAAAPADGQTITDDKWTYWDNPNNPNHFLTVDPSQYSWPDSSYSDISARPADELDVGDDVEVAYPNDVKWVCNNGVIVASMMNLVFDESLTNEETSFDKAKQINHKSGDVETVTTDSKIGVDIKVHDFDRPFKYNRYVALKNGEEYTKSYDENAINNNIRLYDASSDVTKNTLTKPAVDVVKPVNSNENQNMNQNSTVGEDSNITENTNINSNTNINTNANAASTDNADINNNNTANDTTDSIENTDTIESIIVNDKTSNADTLQVASKESKYSDFFGNPTTDTSDLGFLGKLDTVLDDITTVVKDKEDDQNLLQNKL